MPSPFDNLPVTLVSPVPLPVAVVSLPDPAPAPAARMVVLATHTFGKSYERTVTVDADVAIGDKLIVQHGAFVNPAFLFFVVTDRYFDMDGSVFFAGAVHDTQSDQLSEAKIQALGFVAGTRLDF